LAYEAEDDGTSSRATWTILGHRGSRSQSPHRTHTTLLQKDSLGRLVLSGPGGSGAFGPRYRLDLETIAEDEVRIRAERSLAGLRLATVDCRIRRFAQDVFQVEGTARGRWRTLLVLHPSPFHVPPPRDRSPAVGPESAPPAP